MPDSSLPDLPHGSVPDSANSGNLANPVAPTDLGALADLAIRGQNLQAETEQALGGALLTFSTPNNSAIGNTSLGTIPPLLRSLATLIRLKGKVISAQFLLSALSGVSGAAGMSGADRVSPGACLRAATKADFQGNIIYKAKLGDISPLSLPCILLQDDDRSPVLVSIKDNEAQVIFPESGDEVTVVPKEQLEKEYTGYVIFGELENRVDARVDNLKLAQGKNWFWSVIWHYSSIYSQVAVASLIINLIAIASPLFVMNVYDRVVPNNALETLWVLAIGITITYLFDFLLKSLRTHFVDTAGRNADVVLSSSLVNKVLTMRMDSKPESTGALVNNLREFESLREFFSSSTILALIDLPFLFIFLALIYYIAGPLVLLPLCAIPLMLLIGVILQLRAKACAERSYKRNMQKNSLLVEMVNGLETVKSCMGESRMQRLWESVAGISAYSSAESRKYTNRAITIFRLITQLVTVAIVVWGVYRIEGKFLSMGGLIGCNILVGRAMAPLLQTASLLTKFQNSRVSLAALDNLMTLPSENQNEQSCMDFGMLRPALALDNVSFHYPNSDRPILNRINLNIEAGEKVGIIGRMGSGKSTLGKLLIGLYQPNEGAVKFDGVDIRQLASKDLRSRIGVLPQEVILFYGTIRENIAFDDPTINDRRILQAAELAGVADFVRGNPSGFGAQVGEQGRNLSGGQRQAVGLARALVNNPEILILDEPTSNMDTESELTVQTRMHSTVQAKTLVLITHRLSMLQIVDRLIVMDEGRIIHDGPRDAVLSKLQGKGQAVGAEARPQSGPQQAMSLEEVISGAKQAHSQLRFSPSGNTSGSTETESVANKSQVLPQTQGQTTQQAPQPISQPTPPAPGGQPKQPVSMFDPSQIMRDGILPDDMPFASEVEAALVRKPKKSASLLSLAVVAFFAVLVAWASKADIDEVTHAEGQVIASQRIQSIQNLEGGILREMLVREGQIVKAGDLLARLDNEVAESSHRDAVYKSLEHLAAIVRLEAELNTIDPVFPSDLTGWLHEAIGVRINSEINHTHADQIFSDQLAAYRVRTQQRQVELDLLQSQYEQRVLEVNEQAARKKQLAQSLALVTEQRDMALPLLQRGSYARMDYLNLENQVVSLQGELEALASSIPRAQAAAQEAEKRVLFRKIELDAAITAEIGKRRADLATLRETLNAGGDRVTRTELRAPLHGTVRKIYISTVGGVLKPGESILDMVPLDDTLLVEARVRPADVAFLRQGQAAMVKISAYDFSIYGGLEGKLEQISADTIEDRRGEFFYHVQIRTEKNEIEYRGEILPITPGMIATVDIMIGKKTVLDYILKPIMKARQNALRER